VCAATGGSPDQVEVWLGPCIGPRRFEVGGEVLRAFGCDPDVWPRGAAASDTAWFAPSTPGKWLASLPALARDRMTARGVRSISGGTWCTVSDASRFFSFRRDGVTGRMAAVIWLAH
jgi:copper oxidase (laccase) domain-containing protein